MTELKVRPYQPSLRDAVRSFGLATKMGWGRDDKLFTWKYDGPLPPSAPAVETRLWLAVDGAKVVGSFGLMPARLRVRHQRLDAVVPVDIYVLPDYRGRDLFRRMLQPVIDSGVTILGMYGTPASHGRFLAAGFHDVSGLEARTWLRRSPAALWRVVTSSLGWRYQPSQRPTLASLAEALAATVARCQPVSDAHSAEVDRFLDHCLDAYELALHRDWATFRWRYRQHPHSPGVVFSVRLSDAPDSELVAVFVLARRTVRSVETLVLADLLVAAGHDAIGAEIMAALPKMAELAGADLFSLVTMSADLKQIGRRPDRRRPKTASIHLTTMADAPSFKFDRWYLSAGDSDYIGR